MYAFYRKWAFSYSEQIKFQYLASFGLPKNIGVLSILRFITCLAIPVAMLK